MTTANAIKPAYNREQISALAASTVAFAVNFAVWVMFSIIGVKIKAELNLNETEFGLLVATPILTGSLIRLPLGILTDRYGGRIVYFVQMLSVVVPTWLLSYATEYWQYLVLGLFIGVAGGSFAVGIAYTSAWFSKERQGTAMGIFGAGNAGSSLTKFIAPLIIAASATASWRAVPKVYAVAMLVMALVFWFTTTQDPLHRADAQKGRKVPKLSEQLMPLLDVRVWRFGLAYYFVFGAFVAMALWLPKYYVGQYGLPLATAAFLTILFDLPSGAIRALGGWASDKWGGNTVTWWVMWISLICMFLLSYPPTTMIIHGIKGDRSIDIGVGLVLFTVLIFIVGLAQGFGKASVYRSLADHYPTSMGVVGGIVGVIGGLGGFTLPIMFGVAADVIGVRSSCFMLMTLVIVVTMIWMWVAERNEREGILAEHTDCPRGACGRRPDRADASAPPRPRRLEAGRRRFLDGDGPAHRDPQPAGVDARAAAGVRGLGGVERDRRRAAAHRLQVHDQPTVLAGGAARDFGCRVPRAVFVRRADLRRAQLDRVEHDDAAAADAVDRLRGPGPEHELRSVRGDRAAVRSGRRQFLVLDGAHQLPLPETPAGHGAGRERRGGQPGCRAGAAHCAACDVRWRAARHGRQRADRVRSRARWCRCGCRTPGSSGCR